VVCPARGKCRSTWIERNYAKLHDGTVKLLSTRSSSDSPKPYTLALEKLRRERESKLQQLESKFERIVAGASKGGEQGRSTRRDAFARDQQRLLAALQAYRASHPKCGRPAIARALVSEHGRQVDHADPNDRERAIRALQENRTPGKIAGQVGAACPRRRAHDCAWTRNEKHPPS
jgi:hypothetical protein